MARSDEDFDVPEGVFLYENDEKSAYFSDHGVSMISDPWAVIESIRFRTPDYDQMFIDLEEESYPLREALLKIFRKNFTNPFFTGVRSAPLTFP